MQIKANQLVNYNLKSQPVFKKELSNTLEYTKHILHQDVDAFSKLNDRSFKDYI